MRWWRVFLTAILLVGLGADAQELSENLRQAGFTELHAATWRGDIDQIAKLLRMGTNVNVRSSAGITPLHSAAIANKPESAKLLIAAGADLEAREEMGRTPLFVAVEINSRPTEILELLIQSGANINARDKFGKTPLEAARTDAARNVLIRHGAQRDDAVEKLRR